MMFFLYILLINIVVNRNDYHINELVFRIIDLPSTSSNTFPAVVITYVYSFKLLKKIVIAKPFHTNKQMKRN